MSWPFSLLWPGNPKPQQAEPKNNENAAGKAAKEVADAAPSPSHLLQHFEKPGIMLPPSARVGDPKLKQRERPPLSLVQLSKYAVVGAVKGESTSIHFIGLHGFD